MAMMTLSRMLDELGRFSEGDEILHEHFSPRSSVKVIDDRRCLVNWFRLSRIAEQNYTVGVAHSPATGDRILTERTWYEGMDAWEAAGRPSTPELRPRYVGFEGLNIALSDRAPEATEFHNAVTFLHLAYFGNAGRRADEASILKAVERVEAAMRGIEAVELRASGVPDWLVGGTEEEEPAGPRM